MKLLRWGSRARSVDVPHRRLFTPQELRARHDAVRAIMRRRGVEVLLLDQPTAFAWITGADVEDSGYRCCLMPRKGDPVLLVRRTDAARLRAATWIERIETFADWDDVEQLLARIVRRDLKCASGAIGLDLRAETLSAGRLNALWQALHDSRFVDLSGPLREVRRRLSSTEIGLVRKAARLADQAMQAAVDTLGPDRTARDALAAASFTVLRLGGDNTRVGRVATGVGPGWDSDGMELLAPGTAVRLEVSPRLRGYTARLTRTVVLGTPSDAQNKAMRTLINVQDRQIAAMRPGAAAGDVDGICRAGLFGAGLGPDSDAMTGESLGLVAATGVPGAEPEDGLHPRAEWPLQPDTAFHMTACVQDIALGDSVLVTPEGPERLTATERRLFER
jgi:Xaa-Pro dipeptidase